MAGGVNSELEKMNRDAWSESRSSTKNWMMVGMGRKRRGIAGMPSDSEDRDRNTKDWSVIVSRLTIVIRVELTGERPKRVVISWRFEQDGPRTVCGQREHQSRSDTLLDQPHRP